MAGRAVTEPTEAEFQAQVVQLAHTLGWKHLHVRRSIGKGRKWVTTTNRVGWPDLLLWSTRQGRTIAAELKAKGGACTPEQLEVLDELARSGIETFVWWPVDLDEIKQTLTANPVTLNL